MHFHFRQLGQNIRHLAQPGPVVLDVLAGREMSIAAVIGAGDMGQLAHLQGRQGAIRNSDPQHVGVQLQVQTIHQAQGLEFILA